MADEVTPGAVGDNPETPRDPRPTATTETAATRKRRKKADAVARNISGADEIETVTLETAEGREFTIAKSLYDAEMAKPVDAKDIKPGEPVFLRHPDIAVAKKK